MPSANFRPHGVDKSRARARRISPSLTGSNVDDVDGEFNGYIDEVRIYDRALSAEEIKTLAEEARSRVSIATSLTHVSGPTAQAAKPVMAHYASVTDLINLFPAL